MCVWIFSVNLSVSFRIVFSRVDRLVWVVRPRVFQSRTDWPTIRTSVLGWIDFVHLKGTYFMKGLSQKNNSYITRNSWENRVHKVDPAKYRSTSRRSFSHWLKNRRPYYSHHQSTLEKCPTKTYYLPNKFQIESLKIVLILIYYINFYFVVGILSAVKVFGLCKANSAKWHAL